MNEAEALARMVAPGERRAGKYRDGVIQVIVTSSCDKSCYACTQASNLARPKWAMTPEQFELAVRSLGFRVGDGEGRRDDRAASYFGVVGLFGGNPALSPHFAEYCATLREFVPKEQRGIWCNNPITVDKAKLMRETFDPAVSNLNVHLDEDAWLMFKRGWPEAKPVGLTTDSRHSPVHLAMKDVVTKKMFAGGKSSSPFASTGSYETDTVVTAPDEGRIWELISGCDINQHWSAMVGVFRGQLRAWFCEVAGAQAMLHQDEPDYPDTGVPVGEDNRTADTGEVTISGPFIGNNTRLWWQWPMTGFIHQVRKHCFDCGVPLRGYGELSQALDGKEQTSATHAAVFKPKRQGRPVEVVAELTQLGLGRIRKVNHYLQNARV